jgi:hypothetical protein
MAETKVYADFQNADVKGRVRLNCAGTMQDLARQQTSLRMGLVLTLYADDADAQGRPDELEVQGVVEYSDEERCWVAVIDWNAIRHASENGGDARNGVDVAMPLPSLGASSKGGD